ncbi:hypothetical protein IMG5_184860 [Ichthyophthirius multifiliis]|uniref:protein-tyrosine-phosphatase n=1 Tax=Ichthyophthirius multifiliis TaxID=5932 RepID=G0R3E2_ICHMU|nr:hypothetical protein IMG5_184860 [Ichthyophthirius multifiliis]EGR28016.1 hypothetical protein IMG5_184860 [Ichthyophthirius multifiliis]|eukprot:XP_004027361.1 hypothetical protein IMG5_184860 [Ichthyophthirius multifiliis]
MNQNIIQNNEQLDEQPVQENPSYADMVYQIKPHNNEKKHGCLYLGGIKAACDLAFLKENNIKAVLTVQDCDELQYEQNTQINHHKICASDCSTYDIKKDFYESYEFINENLEKTNVLVHCFKGVSRSPTICIAYLMKKENIRCSEAYQEIKKHRKEVNPNGGFMFHLEKFYQEIRQIKLLNYLLLCIQKMQQKDIGKNQQNKKKQQIIFVIGQNIMFA